MDARLEELRRQLNQKTTEIESLLAAERGMGSIEDMDLLSMRGCKRM